MPQKPLPYKAAGARLRERRESLQKAGKIGKLKVLAKEVGVTVSSYLSYERGEYWPKGEKRKRLAVVMGWSDIELDHGPQPQTRRFDESPKIERLIRAFAWLMDDQQEKHLMELEAKAETNKAIAKQMGPRFSYASDETMLDVLKRGGDFPPGSKAQRFPKSPKGSKFKEEDPE